MKSNSCTTSIGTFAPVQTNRGFRQSNFWVWGSSVIRAGDGRSTFNPKLIRWNNLYVLFYTGATHPFAEVALNRESELAESLAVQLNGIRDPWRLPGAMP